ncbi:hypothetical protein ACOMHN_025006 [Nucella lapillus]
MVGYDDKRTRARRCQVPVRTRRRQSDAKWRASVASCYETLKFVIPNGKTLPKRKASKSLILQEVEKHIGNLERAVSRLLNVEAHEQGQGVLWKKGENWSPATVEDFQNDFAKQQKHIFHQSTQGRRCYNMLHDIQEEIISMSVDSGHLAFLPLPDPDTLRTSRDAATCTRRHRVSKARCRYETERASQRILAAYNEGELVNAVIPLPTPHPTATTTSTSHNNPDHPQAVPTTPTNTPSRPELYSGGTTLRLQKAGSAFLSADAAYRRECQGDGMPLQGYGVPPGSADRAVTGGRKVEVEVQHHSSVHEVPVLVTPNKVYGIARHDVMMSQEGGPGTVDQRGFTPVCPPTAPPPIIPSILIKREVDPDPRPGPIYSSVCKKLDFSDCSSERLCDHPAFAVSDPTPYFSSLVGPSSSGFTPIKIQVSGVSGLTPIKQEPISISESHGRSSHISGGGHSVLTPFKVSGSELCMTDTALFSPSASAWPLATAMDARVPQAGGLSDLDEMDDDQGLLCMETMDMDTEVTQHTMVQEKTPHRLNTPPRLRHGCKKRTTCKKRSQQYGLKTGCRHTCSHRSNPQCRKRLEGLYEKLSADKQGIMNQRLGNATTHLDSHSYYSDFDGYLLYYQQVAPALRTRLGSGHDADSLAALVSDMWSQLPTDDRDTMVTLAALENQDSNSSSGGSLSQDLEELDVTPLHHHKPHLQC